MQTENAQSLERWIRRGMYLVLAIPLLPAPSVLFPAVFGRALYFFALTIAVAVLAIYLRTKKPAPPAPTSVITKLLLVYVAISALATAFSISPRLSLWGDQGRADGLAMLLFAAVYYFLVRGFFQTDRERERLITATCSVAAAISVLGILQWFFPVLRGFGGAGGERISGTLGNPILLAGYLAPHVFLAVQRLGSATTPVRRIFWAVCGLVTLVALVLTQSRGALLAVLVAAVVYGVIRLVVSPGRQTRMFAGGALVALAIVIGWTAFDFPGTRLLPQAFQPQAIVRDGVTARTRLINWQIALQGLRDRPLLGWGPEAYRFVFTRHYRPELLRYSFTETISDKPHNLFLEIAVETGALGILAYLAILAVALGSLARSARANLGSAALAAALIALAGQSAFSFNAPMTMILFILLLALATPARRPEAATKETSRFPTILASLGVAPALIALVFIARSLPASADTAAAVDAAANRKPSAWQLALKRAASASSVYHDENLHHLARWLIIVDSKKTFPNLTVKDSVDVLLPRLTDAVARPPHQFVLTFMKGQLLLIKGELDHDRNTLAVAEVAFNDAALLAPGHQSVAVAQGRLKLLQGDPQGAVAVLQKAVDADRALAEPHWFLGIAKVAAGDHPKGLFEMQNALTLGRDLKSVREYTYYIDLLAEAKQFEEVALRYRALIDLQPEEATWHAKLAATYAELGRPELAISEAQRAIALDPSIREHARAFLGAYGITLP